MSAPDERFNRDLTQQEPMAEEAIDAAVRVLRSGRLHRYNTAEGEAGETALLEEEFAAWLGKKYSLACASCGSALFLALKSAGVHPGEGVLCNSYTLAPVPGAIQKAGGIPILLEITEDLTVDLKALESMAAMGKSRFFLISHMRGHIADMDRVESICRKYNILLIEDCAHTMGAAWNGRKSGLHGLVSCYSTQTYKHINSGEGGLLATDDPEIIARAILHSGSYMLYDKHTSRPPLDVFEQIKWEVPNYSCRMDNLRAALLRPQLRELDRQVGRWNERYGLLEELINHIPGLQCPNRDPREAYVGSSIQFSLRDHDAAAIARFLALAEEYGVHIKWFGSPEPLGYTSSYDSWRYLGPCPDLPKTRQILSSLCDMRIPLTLSLDDCRLLAQCITRAAQKALC